MRRLLAVLLAAVTLAGCASPPQQATPQPAKPTRGIYVEVRQRAPSTGHALIGSDDIRKLAHGKLSSTCQATVMEDASKARWKLVVVAYVEGPAPVFTAHSYIVDLDTGIIVWSGGDRYGEDSIADAAKAVCAYSKWEKP